jgi:hypothetical protein
MRSSPTNRLLQWQQDDRIGTRGSVWLITTLVIGFLAELSLGSADFWRYQQSFSSILSGALMLLAATISLLAAGGFLLSWRASRHLEKAKVRGSRHRGSENRRCLTPVDSESPCGVRPYACL